MESIMDPSQLNKYSPSSQVADILLTEKQRLRDNHLTKALKVLTQ